MPPNNCNHIVFATTEKVVMCFAHSFFVLDGTRCKRVERGLRRFEIVAPAAMQWQTLGTETMAEVWQRNKTLLARLETPLLSVVRKWGDAAICNKNGGLHRLFIVGLSWLCIKATLAVPFDRTLLCHLSQTLNMQQTAHLIGPRFCCALWCVIWELC